VNHYRDPLAGLKSQVATKRALLDSRERELSPVLRALLPPSLRRTIEDLHAQAVADGDSMEVLAGIEGALDAVLAAYDEAARYAPELRDSADEVRDPPRAGMPPPWLIEEPYLLRLRDAVRVRLVHVDPDAYVSRFGDFAYISRFKVAGAPYVFVIETGLMPENENVARYTSRLRTSVPESLPSLTVRRERAYHAVGKALHVVREIEVGEPGFDGRFWITGSERTAAVLTWDVRAALERCAHASPVFELSDGAATLSWSGLWPQAISDPLPDGALDVLVGLRVAIATG